MLFFDVSNSKGSTNNALIDIKRSSYTTDTSYYREIMRTIGVKPEHKCPITEIKECIKRQK